MNADGHGLIHAFVLDGRGGGEVLDWDGVERWYPEHGALWLHLDYAEADAQAWLGLGSGIDPVVRDALVDADPRPRALAIDDRLLFIVRGINRNAGAQPEDMVSVRCWIGPERIITLRHRPVHTLKSLAADLTAGTGPRSPADFLATLTARLLEPVVAVVDALDDAVADIEETALTDRGAALRETLADLRRRAISLRRFMAPQRDALGKLVGLTVSWLGDHDRARLREAADRLLRTVEELDAARDRAAVTHEELAGRLSEVSGKRLYVLSIITAVFLPLGFITSLLGVNVGGIPGRDVEWGFWLLCGLFAVAVGIQLWLFWRWKWL